ncbi:MAG: hypothetical protein EB084_07580 [Proteobacteria bacterium]|nr:hypothetical protein [Pseudomonadota bacterium]
MIMSPSEAQQKTEDPSRYQPYDFTRPDKVSHEHKSVLRNQSVPACRLLCIHFGTILQAVVEMSMVEVEDLHYRDVFRPIEGERGGRVMGVFLPGPEQSQGLVIASLNIMNGFLERMMGGNDITPIYERERDLSDFESKLFAKVLLKILSVYLKTFGDDSLTPSIDKLETEATLVPRSYAPEETILRQIFRVNINGAVGYITVCLPFAWFRPKLPQMRHGMGGAFGQGPLDPKMLDEVATVDVPVEVHLGRGRVSLRQLMALAPGDEIMLEGPVLVHVSDVPKFIAKPGLRDDNMAVEIVTPFVADGKDESFTRSI